MNHSIVQQCGPVAFPAFMAERVYMREFRKESGLPSDLVRWQSTIDAMLDGVDTDGPIYLMIDQKALRAGESHRRPGVHVDGYWHPAIGKHQGHRAVSAHGGGGHGTGCAGNWSNFDFSAPEGIILASDVQACRAYAGEFHGAPGEGGDYAHITLSGLDRIELASNTVYAGNVSMLHETVPVNRDCVRTLVRLNVPGWTPQ